MNLHAFVSGAIGIVNPFVLGTVSLSTGSTTNPDGSRTPSYKVVPNVSMQVQPLAYKEIQHLDSLNIQGTRRAVYITGALAGLVRVHKQGGDLVTFEDGSVWLVVLVSEAWNNGGDASWCRVVITLQNGS